jgi:hypothetical protein
MKKTNAAPHSVLGVLVFAVILAIGILTIQQAHAQIDATSSGAVATSSEPANPVDVPTSTTSNPSADTTTGSIPAPAPAAGLVEVRLLCTQSYTTDVYDTPSGHPDPYVKPSVATTTDTSAHIVGTQSFTVCHDARGNVHEFPITSQEYVALRVRGTPQKSVMEPADQAALDSFDNSSVSASDTHI